VPAAWPAISAILATPRFERVAEASVSMIDAGFDRAARIGSLILPNAAQTTDELEDAGWDRRRVPPNAIVHVARARVVIIRGDARVIVTVTAALPARARIAIQVVARVFGGCVGLLLASCSFALARCDLRRVARSGSRALVLLLFASFQALRQVLVRLRGVFGHRAR
jgi:hypothetical protein